MKTWVLLPAAIVFAIILSSLFRGEPALAADICPRPTFVAAGTFGAGSQSVFVAAADFNGDSRPDLVVVNQFSANVSVLIGMGDGTFQAAVNYGAGSGPSSAAVRDFNGDGKLDLAVTDVGTTNVWVLLGNGNGTFQTAASYGVENLSQSVAVGDFNRDGKPDLAVAIRVSALVSVLLGNGDGTFQDPVSYATGPDPFSVAVGDFNSDGTNDLAVANAALFEEPPGVSILLGRGNGTFRTAVDYAAGTSPRSVVVGDFNRDGRPDLVVANYGGFVGSQFTNSSISVLLGNGNGTFQAPVNYQAGEGPLSIVVTDFNGDGKPHLAVANYRSMNVSVLFGNGDGTLAAPANYAAGVNPRWVTAGDFNGDGQPDLAVANDSGVLVLLSTCVAATDLSLTQTDAPDPVAAGSNVIYTLTVTNGGPDPAPDVTMTNQLPAGVSFVGVIASQGGCTNNSGIITCTLGNLTNAAQATISITVTTTAAGSLTNIATAASPTTSDPNTANNSSTAVTTVLPIVSISAADSSASETGPDPAVFTVGRRGGTTGALTVNYTIIGTASNGVDCAALPGFVTIPGGSASATIVVTPVDDLAVEPTETVIVTLALSSAYTIDSSASSATANILDNDVASLLINDVAVTEGNSGFTNAVFNVILSSPISQTVTVHFATTNGTAVAGSDYAPTNGTLSFPPGTTNQSIVVTIVGDALNEPSEIFFVNLSGATNAVIADGRGTGTINDDDPLPSLSINDVTVTEGNGGTIDAVFTVILSAVSGQTVTVDFATADETASAGSDYLATNGTLSFASGAITQTVAVRVNGDLANETDETFFVNLSGAVNASLNDNQGRGSILNDDSLPGLSITDVTVVERDIATTNAIFTVSLSAASAQTVRVGFFTVNGSAVAGSDYVATNGILTFSPGATSQPLIVRVTGDTLDEPNETFFVNISNAVNAAIADGQGIGTISDNDPPPGLFINDATAAEGNNGVTNAVFSVGLSAASGQTVTVNFETADGTASAGSDYVATNGTVTFAAGITAQTIAVTIKGDSFNEIDEGFFVNLSGAVNASLSDNQGAGSILNDDPLPAISITDVTVTEGSDGSSNAVFTVSLSPASGQLVTVDFASADGTATAGTDYVATNGTLNFPPGTTNQTITVIVNGDILNEANENFFVNLSNPTNAVLADAEGVATITNDDASPRLAISDAAVVEGNTGTTNIAFAVRLSFSSTETITVNFATANGTAIGGKDYVSTNGTMEFAPGTTNQSLFVAINGELINETNETFFVNLSNPTGAITVDGQAVGTIVNDDPLPSLSIDNTTVPEGNSGTTDAVFTVRLSAPSDQMVTVNFATANGTATAGLDYNSASGTVTFTPGTTNQTIVIAAIGDVLSEPTETFFVNLSGANNATIGDNQGIGTISNDDPLPAISINNAALFEGNSGTTDAVFIVSLSAPSAQVVAVNYATAHDTTSGNDYRNTSGMLQFNPGQTNQFITVPVNGDTRNEGNETYFVNLSNPVNAVIGNGQGIGTILNDEGVPSILITDVSVVEGNSGMTDAVFALRLTATYDQVVTLSYAAADGTALAGADYVPTNGIVTFAPGTTNQTITVRVIGDRLNEMNETFFLNLFSSTNALIGNGLVLGTINNDDPLPALSIDDVVVIEGDTGTREAVFTVGLSAESGQSVTVNFATASGAAESGGDYVSTNGTLIFAPGTTNRTITVSVLGDLLNEASESFFVNLTAPVNATLSDTQGAGVINNDDPLPSLSVDDVTVTEGDNGTAQAVFTVHLSDPSGRPVTTQFVTSNGTATEGSDYVRTNGSLSFAPGTTSQTFAVAVLGDLLNESNETFFVDLTNVINAAVSDGRGRGTINNDDPLPTLSIGAVTVTEGNNGTTNAVFMVKLTPVSGQMVSVDFGTSNGTAVAGSDYVATNGTLSFVPGATNSFITVRVNNDLLYEADETFFVNLSNPNSAILANSQATGTINNDDPLPSLSINDVAFIEGDSGITNAVFTVSLSAVSGLPVTVSYATANGTAVSGSDYFATNGVLTFAPDTITQTITVRVRGDIVNESDQTYFVNLFNPANATVSDGQGLGTINNDDPPPIISVADVVVSEGNSGTVDALFAVRLSAPSEQVVIVNFATADGTATAGADYVATNGTINFAEGTTNQPVIVKVVGDAVHESNETFLVNLSNPVNAVIGGGQAVGTISNDDALPSLSINDITLAEGNTAVTGAVFTVRLSALSGQMVTVHFATANGTATAGTDYISTSGTVTFAPGTTNQAVTVAVIGDVVNESNETFFVNLSGASHATISDGQGTGTIVNDDPVVSIRISDAAVVEGNSSTTNAVFTVSLSAVSGQLVTVNYATASGTASGNDYGNASGTLRFDPGQSNQFITVPVDGDTRNEDNETFFVNLSAPVNATLANNQGVGTILNDDRVPSISITDVSVNESDTGTTNAVFSVRLSDTSAQVVTLSYATSDGTALAGADYAATNGIVSFAPGTTNQTISVRVFGDRLTESNETFFVNLFSATNAVISDGQGRGTIQDNDPLHFLLSTNSLSVVEGGTNSFAVRLIAAPSSNVIVTVSRTAGSTNLNVRSGDILTFTPNNWNVFQTVVISSAEDQDTIDDHSTFTVSSPISSQIVNAIGLDNDLEELRITSVELAGGNILIRFTTISNQRYRVERTDNLAGNLWVTVAESVQGTGGIVQTVDIATPWQQSRFYRVVLLSASP